MKLLYLDLTGGRQWRDIRAAQNVLSIESTHYLSANSVLFIHWTDFEKGINGWLSEFPVKLGEDLVSFVEMVRRTNKIGDGNTLLVFITGKHVFNERDREYLFKLLGEHCPDRIVFRSNIKRHATGQELEYLFGQLIDGVAEGRSIAKDSGTEIIANQLNEALRLLWQTYCLALSSNDVVPAQLVEAKKFASRAQLFLNDNWGHIYWEPVLIGGRLNELLVSSPDEDMREVVEALSHQDNWDNLDLSSQLVEEYTNKWFEDLEW